MESEMDASRHPYSFKIKRLDNATFIATLMGNQVSSGSNSSYIRDPGKKGYDDTGALYYVVAVVFIYGFSIVLMIGSLIKKNKSDNGVTKYMKEMDKVRRLERRQMKFKTRMAMHQRGIPGGDFGCQRSDSIDKAFSGLGINIGESQSWSETDTCKTKSVKTHSWPTSALQGPESQNYQLLKPLPEVPETPPIRKSELSSVSDEPLQEAMATCSPQIERYAKVRFYIAEESRNNPSAADEGFSVDNTLSLQLHTVDEVEEENMV